MRTAKVAVSALTYGLISEILPVKERFGTASKVSSAGWPTDSFASSRSGTLTRSISVSRSSTTNIELSVLSMTPPTGVTVLPTFMTSRRCVTVPSIGERMSQ